ncbi:MAG: peptidylprolyl isomerase [Gammaproteobacteria bacterium]|nr:peptidylprolyl isomerase [Gammaproteobacteria bacterium]
MLQLVKRTCTASILFVALLTATPSNATIIEFQTSLGNFQVNLYDETTPASVTNFLNYVNNGAYSDSIVHRSVPGFIIQGGGFAYDGTATNPVVDIPADPAVTNEPTYSNLRGTIAMAKISGDPNSATNQWFINLADNSASLDPQNGGFTVFGEVTGNGMDVVDAIAALPRFAFNPPLNEMPLQNFTSTDFNNAVIPDDTQFIIVSAVIVTDTTVNSAAGLNPAPNTLINAGGGGTPPPATGGGGGSFDLLLLLSLMLIAGVGVVARRVTVRDR